MINNHILSSYNIQEDIDIAHIIRIITSCDEIMKGFRISFRNSIWDNF
jgi:hypothetical protein